MPDGRFLSKSIAYSAQVGSVSLEADYLFMRMIPHLDSAGRMTGEPMSVKALCCPLRAEVDGGVVERCLGELENARLIRWYEVGGARYVEMPGFAKHQRGARLDREAPSRLPTPRGPKVRRTPEFSGKGRLSKEKLSEVKRSEVKRSKEKKDLPRAAKKPAAPQGDFKPRDSWLGPSSRTWAAKFGDGSFPFGKAARLLAALRAVHEPGTIAEHLKRYLDNTEPRYASLARFAETFAQWGPTNPHALVDEWGVLTPFGEKETRPASLKLA